MIFWKTFFWILCTSISMVFARENIRYGNHHGQNASNKAIMVIGEIYEDVYHWQDEVNFNTEETLRNLRRFEVEFLGNLEQLGKLVGQFMKIFNHSMEEPKKTKLLTRLNSLSNSLFIDMVEDSAEMSTKTNKVYSDLSRYYFDLVMNKKHIELTEQNLASLRNVSMAEIIESHFNITRMDKNVKRMFNTIDSKHKEVKVLKAAIVALNVADLGVMFIPGVNFFAMLALQAATIALEVASGKISQEIEDLTKVYLEDLKRLHTMKLQLDFIDIDTEKVHYFKTQFKKMVSLMERTEENKNSKLEKWEKISIWMDHLSSLLGIGHEVIRQGLVDFHKVDMANIKSAWDNIKKLAAD